MGNQKKPNFSILALLVVIYVDALSWGLVFPLFAPLILNNSTELLPASISSNLRGFIYEFAIAIYCIFMFLFSPILGSLSDKYGRKKILLLSMIGSAIGFFVSAGGLLINSLLVILLGRVLSGITSGSLAIAQAAMIDLSNDTQKASRLGLIALANGVGFTSGPLLGGLLQQINIVGINNNELVFLAGAIFGIIGAVIVKLFFQETFFEYNKLPINFMTSVKNISEAFTFDKTRAYFTCFLVSMLAYILFFSTLPVYLHNKFNLSGTTTGYFLSYFAIMFSLSLCVLLPKVFRTFSLDKIVVTSLIVQLIAYLLFALTNSFLVMSILAIPVAFVAPMMYVGIVTLISNNTDNLHQGKVMGVVGSVFALAWALGPLLGGLLDEINIIAPLFGAIVFLSLGMFILSIKKSRYNFLLSNRLKSEES